MELQYLYKSTDKPVNVPWNSMMQYASVAIMKQSVARQTLITGLDAALRQVRGRNQA